MAKPDGGVCDTLMRLRGSLIFAQAVERTYFCPNTTSGIMAGIYIHIPFCKKRCIYCDFFSTTRLAEQQAYVGALCKEMELRKGYLEKEPIQTIYLGGGTPSTLKDRELSNLFHSLEQSFDLSSCQEITMECNPDDLSPEYVRMLRTLPVNRLSMGIQTFNDDLLRLLNRRHSGSQAIEAVHRVQDSGIGNISIDLIYGLPGQSRMQWQEQIDKALSLGVTHISAYHLIYEEGTVLERMLEEGRIREIDEEDSLEQYRMLIDGLSDGGYQHYEISNFCKPGLESRHNSSYWEGIPYLGLGAAAHSYDRTSREWNVSDLERYIKGIATGRRDYEVEHLDGDTRYNELMMTGLRTSKGVSILDIERLFGKERLDYCLQAGHKSMENGHLQIADGRLRLTSSGVFVSDSVISDLMYV